MVGKAQSDDLDVRHSVNVRPDSERLLRDEKRYWRLGGQMEVQQPLIMLLNGWSVG